MTRQEYRVLLQVVKRVCRHKFRFTVDDVWSSVLRTKRLEYSDGIIGYLGNAIQYAYRFGWCYPWGMKPSTMETRKHAKVIVWESALYGAKKGKG